MEGIEDSYNSAKEVDSMSMVEEDDRLAEDTL